MPVQLDIPPLPVGFASCDRCNAIAYFRVVVDAARSHWLDFCGHHFRMHEPAFIGRGYAVEDQSKMMPGGQNGCV